MLTPSLVMVGAPHFFSRTTLRPLGPNVTLTASASWFIPRSRPRRASSLKAISFGMSVSDSFSDLVAGSLPATDDQAARRTLPAVASGLNSPDLVVVTLDPRVPVSCLALAPPECKRPGDTTSTASGLESGYLLAMKDPRRPIRLPEKASTERADLDALLDAARVGHFATVADDGTPVVIPTMVVR